MFDRDRFWQFTADLEGYTTWFYLDTKGIVTIGIGNAVAPPDLLAGLIFLRPSGDMATPSEVSHYWLAVNNRQDLKGRGGFDPVWQGALFPKLRATAGSIAARVERQLVETENVARRVFGAVWDQLPKDAQLVVLSMGWAMGDRWDEFPKFRRALARQDWETAAVESHMSEINNAPLAERNVANAKLLRGLICPKV